MNDDGINAEEWEKRRMAYMAIKEREVREYLHGPPVVCVETGILYASEREAARAVNVSRSEIHKAVRTGRRVAWFHWVGHNPLFGHTDKKPDVCQASLTAAGAVPAAL